MNGSDALAKTFSSVFEDLAATEHDRWAHWQDYVHSKAVRRADGSLVIPAELVERWDRLIHTPYAELTEEEKQSDRQQVLRYLPIVARVIGQT